MISRLSPALDALAGEFALGVLEGEARAKALRHTIADNNFAASVASWHKRFEPLLLAYEEAPPPDLWRSIEAQLDRQLRTRDVREIRFWRGTTFVATGLAASLAAVMIFNPVSQRPSLPQDANAAPAVFAQLAGNGNALLAADLDPAKDELRIRAVALPETALVPELWVIPADGVPRSLGLIRPEGISEVTLTPTQRKLIADGAVLAISLEKADGAPHSAPSSTPIATGTITSI